MKEEARLPDTPLDAETKEAKELIQTAGLSDPRVWREAYLRGRRKRGYHQPR